MANLTLKEEFVLIENTLKTLNPKSTDAYVYRTALRIINSLKTYHRLEPAGHFAKMFRIGLVHQRAVVIQYEDGAWFGSFETGKKSSDQSLVLLLKKMLGVK